MSLSESDIVLSAIRRGEETLPKLKAATGLSYATLQKILYSLECTTVRKEESFEGFARYYPSSNGTKAPDHHDKPVSVPPSYNKRTEAAGQADEAALEQRNAPYCVACRGLCVLSGADDGRRQWRCWTCKLSFPGSLMEVRMAHIDEHEVGEQRVREIVEAGGGGLPGVCRECQQGFPLFDRLCFECMSPEQRERYRSGDKVEVAPKHEDLGPEEEATIEAMREPDETVAVVESGLCWCGREIEEGYKTHRGQHRSVTKKKAKNNGGGVKVKAAKLRKAAGAKATSTTTLQEDERAETSPVGEKEEAAAEPDVVAAAPVALIIEEVMSRLQITLEQNRRTLTETEAAIRTPAELKPVWSRDFEMDDSPEGSQGMAVFYLMTILHDGMEELEKQAVWTLILYMKRMQARWEAAKAAAL